MNVKSVLAGVVYDFAAYLTTRDAAVVAGAAHDAAPVAELVRLFLTHRGLADVEAVVHWEGALEQFEAAPTNTVPLFTAEQVREAVAAERERAAQVCDDEARIRTEAGNMHPEDSDSRDRCFAAARAALNCAKGVRGGEVVEAERTS